MNPLDRITGDMNANGLINWTNDVNELINGINKLINPYKAVLDRYEDAHDVAVGDEEKENVDNIIMELNTVKNNLCAIRGGRRNKGKRHTHNVTKRTRKHRL